MKPPSERAIAIMGAGGVDPTATPAGGHDRPGHAGHNPVVTPVATPVATVAAVATVATVPPVTPRRHRRAVAPAGQG